MSTSESMKRASKKYIAEKLDEIKFRVPKGMRARIKEHANRQGESVNGFLLRAAEETMERDGQKKVR